MWHLSKKQRQLKFSHKPGGGTRYLNIQYLLNIYYFPVGLYMFTLFSQQLGQIGVGPILQMKLGKWNDWSLMTKTAEGWAIFQCRSSKSLCFPLFCIQSPCRDKHMVTAQEDKCCRQQHSRRTLRKQMSCGFPWDLFPSWIFSIVFMTQLSFWDKIEKKVVQRRQSSWLQQVQGYHLKGGQRSFPCISRSRWDQRMPVREKLVLT